MPKLTILIATLPEREKMFNDLRLALSLQIETKYRKAVEIISDSRTDLTIGEKRQELLMYAEGDYVVFIDDDDEIADDYIESIITAIEKSDSKADCIGFRGKITTDGSDERKWSISIAHKTWHERDNMYFRTPNHISPIKRELALKCGFNGMSYAEDHDFSMRVFPYLKREVFIDKELYHYKYVSKK